MGLSARCAAGLSGCAPCRLCRHGHSASIPHAVAPAALRLPIGESPAGYPRRVMLGVHRCGRTRWRLLRQVVQMRAVLDAGSSSPVCHETTRSAYPWSPHATPQDRRRKMQRGVIACRQVLDLARVSGRSGAAFMRGCRAGHIFFRSGSAQCVLVSL